MAPRKASATGAPRIQSLARADKILEILAQSSSGSARLGEIAASCGLHKNTAFSLLKTLEQLSYVVRVGDGRAYGLGLRLFEFAKLAESRLNLLQLSRPVMFQLLGLANESVSVAIPGPRDALIVRTLESSHGVRGSRFQGQHVPYHASALGKAILASMIKSDRDHLLDSLTFKRWTERTITDKEALEKELNFVRAKGFSISVEEEEMGANAVGAPLCGRMGEVIGAVAIWGPASRLPRVRLAELGIQMVKLCSNFLDTVV